MKNTSLAFISGVVIATLLGGPNSSADGPDVQPADRPFLKTLQPFFSRYCVDCHGEGADEGGFDLDRLGGDLTDPETFTRWERIFDRVDAKEMPPKDVQEVPAQHSTIFARVLSDALNEAHAASKATTLRRLNRQEYQNTLNDLFGTNVDLESRLPEDGRSHEFDNVGSALGLSMVHLQQYLDAIDGVMEAAIAQSDDPPQRRIISASYADSREGEKFIGELWELLDDGAVVFYQNFGYPSGMLRDASADLAGYYKIRVTGYAYRSERPITFRVGGTSFQRGSDKPTFGYGELRPGKDNTVELEGWLEPRMMIEVDPIGIFPDNYNLRNDGVSGYQGPGLAIKKIELDGPIVEPYPSRGHRLIFEGLERREVEPKDPRSKHKRGYRPEFQIVTEQLNPAIVEVLKRVATQAFRRPVDEADLRSFKDLYDQQRVEGGSIEDALRTAIAAIFCAPEFLFLQEPEGLLDDYALAVRLSYFLSRTTPDAELLDRAERGELTRSPSALIEETNRLLADRRFERFIVDFSDAWLNLRDIEFTSPDQKLFPEFDPYLQHSSLSETHAFIRKLIEENLPVTNLVKSDFAMLNQRLAEHYEISPTDNTTIQGPQIRSVRLPENSLRGGLLSQASILKVSANGTSTSPVVRGVWVMERILGEPPQPPPPGIPGVEPDIRGATTLRELLAKHRDIDSCRSCHDRIDPPGFALECFDPIGGYRERFRNLGEGDRVDLQIRGRRVQYKLGPPVDASGELADGRSFADFNEFREQLVVNRQQLATALVTKLLTFATGREMGFSDRPTIAQIVSESESSGYGIRHMIELVVTSEAFRRK